MKHYITDITLGRLLGLSQLRIAKTYVRRDQETHGHLPDIVDRGVDFARKNPGKARLLIPPGACKAICESNPGWRGVPRIITYVEKLTGLPWAEIQATPRGAPFTMPGAANPHGRTPGIHTPCAPPAPIPKPRSAPIPKAQPETPRVEVRIEPLEREFEVLFVNFNGEAIPCLWFDNQFWGFIGFTSALLGLDRDWQVSHLQSEHYAKDKLRAVSVMLPGDTQKRRYIVAPRKVFGFWLARINTSLVAADVRDFIEEYQLGIMEMVDAFCATMMGDKDGAAAAFKNAADILKKLTELTELQLQNAELLKRHDDRLERLEKVRNIKDAPRRKPTGEDRKYQSALDEL